MEGLQWVLQGISAIGALGAFISINISIHINKNENVNETNNIKISQLINTYETLDILYSSIIEKKIYINDLVEENNFVKPISDYEAQKIKAYANISDVLDPKLDDSETTTCTNIGRIITKINIDKVKTSINILYKNRHNKLLDPKYRLTRKECKRGLKAINKFKSVSEEKFVKETGYGLQTYK